MKVVIDVATKGTCWSIHPRDRRDSPLQRTDVLIGFNRIYIRTIQKYCYQFIIGRLMILVAF